MATQQMIRQKLKCIYVNEQGQGVVSYKDVPYVVNGLLEGEEAIIDLSTINRKYGNIIEIIEKSSDRINIKCPYFLECGGCDLLHFSYSKELEFKQNLVAQEFKKYNKAIKVNPIIKSDNEYHYRNKLQMTFKLSKQKNVVSGFYEEGTHKIIPVKDCSIQDKIGNTIMNNINLALTKNKIMPFDENTGHGVIKHVVIRVGIETKEVMVVIVTVSDLFPGRNNFLKTLLSIDKSITTIVQNINERDTSIVLGEKERVLYGPGFIFDNLYGFKFKIGPKSFYQVNPIQTEKLYSKALEFAKIDKTDVVLDAYSGIATIGLLASKFAKHVICVEQNKDACKDAQLNIKANRIQNVSVLCDDSTNFIHKLVNDKQHIDILFLDPPRGGSTTEFIKSACTLNPKRIIYVSCNCKTLIRDLPSFIGYEVTMVQPVDMFSKTVHVEVVAVLHTKSECDPKPGKGNLK